MLVGENPGKNEDKQGKPFIGRSGELLDEIFEDLNIDREELYITNAVRCFSYREDPKPTDKELRLCKPYLVEEINRVSPNVICAMGATALKATLNRTGIKKLKNNVFFSDEFNIKVVPTFHPAFVLRNPGLYDDLRKGIELTCKEQYDKELVNKPQTKTRYLIADTHQKISNVLDALEKESLFTFDWETSSLEYLSAKRLCLSLSWQVGLGVVIPWDLMDEALTKRIIKIFTSDKLKANHNIKFDLQICLANKLPVKGPFFDTMTAHALVNENMRHGLDDLVLHYLDMGEYWADVERYKGIIAKERKIKKDEVSYDMLPTSVLYPYAARDSDASFRLTKLLQKELDRQGLTKFYNEHTLPLMPIILEMEYRGIKIDRPKLKDLIEQYQKKEQTLDEALHDDLEVHRYEEAKKKTLAKGLQAKYEQSKMLKSRYPDGVNQYITARIKDKDYKFNFNSPKQLSELLFTQMGIKPIKKTKTGWSTDAEVMEELDQQGIIIAKKIVEHRKLVKYIATYLVSTYERSAYDGRIHTSYLQHSTSTGRLSSEHPNMQNIPRDANDFKSCFLADPGYVFVKADLAQAEFRTWAHYAQDEDMISDIESGLDIHRKIASQVFDVDPEEVTKDQRTAAKNCVFGLMFGRGAKAIAQQYGISLDEANNIRKTFFDMYPVASEWLDEIVKFAKKNGYVKTWFGRIRRLPDILSDDNAVRAEAERQARNSPIQGQASDMNNAYMVRIVKQGRKQGIRFYPAMTTHDENAFQVHKDDLIKLKKLAEHVVATAFPDFLCKMELEFKVGKTLGTVEEMT